MAENFNFLFQYLDKVDIILNKPEFEFQIQSHPNYPTLVSIADTLIFFKIVNAHYRSNHLKSDYYRIVL